MSMRYVMSVPSTNQKTKPLSAALSGGGTPSGLGGSGTKRETVFW